MTLRDWLDTTQNRTVECNIVFACLLLGCMSVDHADAQMDASSPEPAYNSVFLELGGSAALYSVNFDRIVVGTPASSLSLVGRVGVMYIPGTFTPTRAILVASTTLIDYQTGHIELGGGRVFGEAHDLEYPPGWTFIVGYRHQPRNGGLMYRISLTPLVGDPDRFQIRESAVWGGISVGYSF